MTHVFISWSGTIGNRVAVALSDWLPEVIQELTVFVSQRIPKGELWLPSIAGNLDAAAFGIVCVTRDSKTSPWLHYEAGALGQKVENRQDPKVATFLHKVDVGVLDAPLSLVQATTASQKEDVLQLVKAINEVCVNPLADARLLQSFERNYQYLETTLEEIPETDRGLKPGELEGTEPEGVVPDTTHLLQEIIVRLDRLQMSEAKHEHIAYELLQRRDLSTTMGPLRAGAFLNRGSSQTAIHRIDRALIDGRDKGSYVYLTSMLRNSGLDFRIVVEDDGEVIVVFGLDPLTDPRRINLTMGAIQKKLSEALIEAPDVIEHDENHA